MCVSLDTWNPRDARSEDETGNSGNVLYLPASQGHLNSGSYIGGTGFLILTEIKFQKSLWPVTTVLTSVLLDGEWHTHMIAFSKC
jgi:hypothetical protein